MDGSQMDLGLDYLLYEFAVCACQHTCEIHRSQALPLLQSKSSSKKLYNFKTSHDTFLKYGFLVRVGWRFPTILRFLFDLLNEVERCRRLNYCGYHLKKWSLQRQAPECFPVSVISSGYYNRVAQKRVHNKYLWYSEGA